MSAVPMEPMITQQENNSTGIYLVVGSLRTARDQTYLAVAEKLERLHGKSRVGKYLWDRIVGQAAHFTPQSVSASHIILAADDVQGWTLRQLVQPIREATAEQGTLDISVAGMDSAQIQEALEQGGFEVVAVGQGAGVSARKRAPLSSGAANGRGHSMPLRRLRANADPKTKAKLWALSAPPNEAELIDEEALLTEEDRLRPSLVTRPDCDVKRTRKACKNCSCGLRELELEMEEDLPAGASRSGPAAVEQDLAEAAVQGEGPNRTKVRSGAVTSSCGSCYLGDAFRCSGCPYLGLPAFEPGQRVQLTDAMGDDS